MKITFRQLRLMESVARNASYTRASEELFLTQPAVSTQIKQLEQEVGLPLFEQLGKKIFLTEAGKEMYEFSRGIAQQIQNLEAVFDDLKGVRRGNLSLTVTSTGKYFAPYLLAEFVKLHPGTQVHLEVTNREELLVQLQENIPNMAIMGRPPNSLELISREFMDNPLVVFSRPDHPLAGVKNIPVSQLMEYNFILRERGSGTRNAVESFFKQHNSQLKASMEMSRNEAVKHSVMAGLGLGIISLQALEFELALNRVAILDVVGFPLVKKWYLVYRAGKRMSPIAQEFHDFVLYSAKSIIPNSTAMANHGTEKK
jgi:DNA-binding transcriptional LysR family regulator